MASISSLLGAAEDSSLQRYPRRNIPGGDRTLDINITLGGRSTSIPNLRFQISDFMSDNTGERRLIQDIYRRALRVARAGEAVAEAKVPVDTGRLRGSLDWQRSAGFEFDSPLSYHPVQEARVGYMQDAFEAMRAEIGGNVVARIKGWIEVTLGSDRAIVRTEGTATLRYSSFISVRMVGDSVVMRVE